MINYYILNLLTSSTIDFTNSLNLLAFAATSSEDALISSEDAAISSEDADISSDIDEADSTSDIIISFSEFIFSVEELTLFIFGIIFSMASIICLNDSIDTSITFICLFNSSLTLSVVSTTKLVSFDIFPINLVISPEDFLLCSASFLISSATTANPLPASPALAASIAAFKASRFVWSAIAFMVFVISLIPPMLSPKLFIFLLTSSKALLISFIDSTN